MSVSIVVQNQCASESINWQILIIDKPPQTGQVAAGESSVVPIPDDADAISLVGFSGDCYQSAPGEPIGNAILCAVDSGGTPQVLAAPLNSGGMALLYNASSTAATVTVQASAGTPASWQVPAGTPKTISLDSTATWFGFTGFADACDMYMVLPPEVSPMYQATLLLCDSGASETEVHEAVRKAGAA